MISQLSSFWKEEYPKGEVVGKVCCFSDVYYTILYK